MDCSFDYAKQSLEEFPSHPQRCQAPSSLKRDTGATLETGHSWIQPRTAQGSWFLARSSPEQESPCNRVPLGPTGGQASHVSMKLYTL
jgi:hypothetical protein